jgi:hypothetical protein
LIRAFAGSKEAKRMTERNNIIREIMTTERTYVRCLDTMRNSYLLPLKKILRDDPKYPVTLMDLDKIFMNVEQIHMIQTMFLHELERRILEWPRIYFGDVFVNFSTFFALYETFITQYHDAVTHIGKLQASTPIFEQFCTKVRSETSSLNLPSLLITPVQRLPRYKMLLEQLLKFTPEEHFDYKPIKDALEKVATVVLFINEKRRELELSQVSDEVKEIMGSKIFWNLDLLKRRYVGGKFLDVSKDGGKPVRSYVYIFSDVLVIFKVKVENVITKTYDLVGKTLSLGRKGSGMKLDGPNKPITGSLTYESHLMLNPKNVVLLQEEPSIGLKVGENIYSFSPDKVVGGKAQDLMMVVGSIKFCLENPPEFDDSELEFTKKETWTSQVGSTLMKPVTLVSNSVSTVASTMKFKSSGTDTVDIESYKTAERHLDKMDIWDYLDKIDTQDDTK